jgi:hypothetical protein
VISDPTYESPDYRYSTEEDITIDIDAIKARVECNAHDLGEFGKVIRLEYLFNILDELAFPTALAISRDDAEPCPCGMQQDGKHHQVWCALYNWG